KYSDSLYTKAFRVVADHVRGAVFMISDGVYPSNTEQGYVLRRLVRRAVRYADILGLPEQSFVHLVGPLVESYRDAYPILDSQRESIESVIRDEETKFRKTLVKGMKELDRMIALKNEISGKDIFVLFTTYGFPVDMTREIVSERGALFDEEGYLQEFRKHQDLSRTASGAKFKGGLADHGDKTTALHTVTHLMLAGLRKELGDHVHQAGSNITQERTRFDFTHPEKVSRDVLDRVEEYVNEAIAKNVRVRVSHMQKEEAKSTGVEGSFWEKYPDVVNVYSVIDDDGVVYSRELCGGPHVEETGVIKGVFRIKKEESSSAGVRRIKAVLMEG
ncbi:MAG: alanine--tRNA ligase, partial [Candidatus Moranbacteria bacterium]|nr:alanine--tRNA ligase [Candidatus Moranbacteria bacterium]